MESRSHGLLINAAGFIYASLGFSLSVLTALLGIFSLRKKDDAVTIPLHTKPAQSSRGRRPVRAPPPPVPPEKAVMPPTPPPSSPIQVQTQEQPRKFVTTNTRRADLRRSVSAHELHRSKSMIPIITVDYFGSPDSPHRITSTQVVAIDSPKPTTPKDAVPAVVHDVRTFVISPPSSPPASISSTESNSKHDRSGFRIFHPKSWGKDKDKDKSSSKNLQRRQSSPNICPAPGLCPARTTQPAGPPAGSDGTISSSSTAITSSAAPKRDVKRSRSLLRKMPSLPTHEKQSSSNASASRKAEKKRSQTLRTHPYEAPYFAIPPVPPLPPAYKETISSNPPSRNIDKKHSKPRLTTP